MGISTRKDRRLALKSPMTDEGEVKQGSSEPSTRQGPAEDDDDTSIEERSAAVEEKKLTPEEEEEKKKRDAELREKYKDWPMRNIKEPHDNDVMYGRGGGTNHHPGNKQYRKMVEDRKLEYVNCKRLDKPLVALEIIREWRSQIPSGRFLKLDEKTGLWNDVGDKKAREKTSQALREKAPMIRKQQDDEDGDEDEDPKEGSKSTRFAEGTKEEDANLMKKAVLARDHSLGREYIEAGQAVSLDGFSWQDPFQPKQRETSYGRPTVPGSYPAGRNSSHGSLGMPPPHHHVSVGGPPPPPDYWGHASSTGPRQREFSSGRIESWGSTSYGYFMAPPPPPPPPGHAMHQRSGSWTHGPPPHPGSIVHRRSGSWGSGREHSFGMIPLIGASIAGPADQGIFDSGQSWGEGLGSPARGVIPVSAPPPPPAYDYGGGRIPSSGSLGPYRQPTSPVNSTPSPKPYEVDMSIARTWSGNQAGPRPPQFEDLTHVARSVDTSPIRDMEAQMGGVVPKPQIVKRDTSHQNESLETKPSIKRAALNRDNSLASNRLKQQYMPEYFNGNFDAEQEVRSLSTNLEQSTIDTARPKPKPLRFEERLTTIDVIAMELMAKPSPILKDDRASTIDALDLDLDDDPLIEADQPEIGLENLPKPKSLEPVDRLTTKDFMDLVNSPLAGVDETTEEDNQSTSLSFLPLNRENQLSDDWLA